MLAISNCGEFYPQRHFVRNGWTNFDHQREKIKIKSVDLLHLDINKLRLIAVSRESAGGVSGLRGSLFCIKV